MSNLLYLIAIILVIGWLLGFFFFSLGGLIHILLVFALIAIIFRLIGAKHMGRHGNDLRFKFAGTGEQVRMEGIALGLECINLA